MEPPLPLRRPPPLGFSGIRGANIPSYPTPAGLEDVLFYEEEEVTIGGKQEWSYGTAHHDPERYPDHVLVFVQPHSTQNKQRRFYAAARLLQDEYNWEFSQADIGGTKFNTVVRTYVQLRVDFDPASPAMGDNMPNAPSGKFGGDMTLYPLGERVQIKIEDPILASLFVIERRTYVKRVAISEINDDPQLGAGFRKVTTLYYRGESVGGTPVETLFLNGALAFWGLQSDGSINTGQQLSENWYAVINTGSRDAAFLAWKQVTPSKTDLRLPDVLNSIAVVWNSADGDGYFNSEWQGLSSSSPDVDNSLNGAESARANGGASIQPDLSINITQSDGRDIPCLDCFFYMKMTSGEISDAALMTRLATVIGHAVSHWPIFHPVSHTIVLKGQKVNVSAQASASASISARGSGGTGTISWDKNEGAGADVDCSTMMGTKTISPTIHGAITITGATSSASATAACDVGWTGTGTGATINGHAVTFPSVVASESISASASGAVSPTSLSATSPSSIPSSGWYVTRLKFSAADAAWQRVYAEVINAADL